MRIAHPRHVWHRRNRLSDYKILLYFDSLLSARWNSSQVFFSRRHSLQNSPFSVHFWFSVQCCSYSVHRQCDSSFGNSGCTRFYTTEQKIVFTVICLIFYRDFVRVERSFIVHCVHFAYIHTKTHFRIFGVFDLRRVLDTVSLVAQYAIPIRFFIDLFFFSCRVCTNVFVAYSIYRLSIAIKSVTTTTCRQTKQNIYTKFGFSQWNNNKRKYFSLHQWVWQRIKNGNGQRKRDKWRKKRCWLLFQFMFSTVCPLNNWISLFQFEARARERHTKRVQCQSN